MKTNLKYQWSSFFDYVGSFDSTLKGKRDFFFQRIRHNPKTRDKKYFTHIWEEEKEKTKQRISKYSHLINLRNISLPLILLAVICAIICFLFKSWLFFSISCLIIISLIPYWLISRDFSLSKDTCISYLQWMDKMEVQGKVDDMVAEVCELGYFSSDPHIIADFPEITQSELTALIAVLTASKNLKLSIDSKEFLHNISNHLTLNGKEVNSESFYKSYNRFKKNTILIKSPFYDLLDKLKGIDLDKI